MKYRSGLKSASIETLIRWKIPGPLWISGGFLVLSQAGGFILSRPGLLRDKAGESQTDECVYARVRGVLRGRQVRCECEISTVVSGIVVKI